MRIWKYPLTVMNEQTLILPPGAQLLTVQVQDERPCLWALVDERAPSRQMRHLAIYGTGHPLPENPGTYIGTFQLRGGAFVGHVFELPDE